jgi:hypothetical protein
VLIAVDRWSTAAERERLTISKDRQTLELENYGFEPAQVTEVRIEK